MNQPGWEQGAGGDDVEILLTDNNKCDSNVPCGKYTGANICDYVGNDSDKCNPHYVPSWIWRNAAKSMSGGIRSSWPDEEARPEPIGLLRQQGVHPHPGPEWHHLHSVLDDDCWWQWGWPPQEGGSDVISDDAAQPQAHMDVTHANDLDDDFDGDDLDDDLDDNLAHELATTCTCRSSTCSEAFATKSGRM